jgi:hypothetical protein
VSNYWLMSPGRHVPRPRASGSLRLGGLDDGSFLDLAMAAAGQTSYEAGLSLAAFRGVLHIEKWIG